MQNTATNRALSACRGNIPRRKILGSRYRRWCLSHSAYSTTCTSFPYNHPISFDSVGGQSATDQDFFHIIHDDDVDCPVSHLLVFVVDGSFVCRRA